jgi:hypothetical protein
LASKHVWLCHQAQTRTKTFYSMKSSFFDGLFLGKRDRVANRTTLAMWGNLGVHAAATACQHQDIQEITQHTATLPSCIQDTP